MANEVKLTARTNLLKLLEDLDKLKAKGQEISDTLKESGKDTSDSLSSQTKRVETNFQKISSFGRRVAEQLRGDFKTLFSIGGLAGGLKLSQQFANAVTEAVNLTDTIRKLGQVFGISRDRFRDFQSNLTKGLGDIGLSSDTAARAIEGLAASGAQVTGEQAVQRYAITAGQLASVTNQRGQEANVARLLAQTLQARGISPNNEQALQRLAEDTRRVFNATGATATDTLNGIKTIFQSLPQDLRQNLTSQGVSQLATISAVAGPQATKFLEEFLGKSPIARKAFEAQGFSGVFTEQGLDINKFRQASGSILSRVGGDPRLAAQTLGLSEEAAEGFVRLAESLDRVKSAQDEVIRQTGNLNQQFDQNKTLSEAFTSNFSKFKAILADPLSTVIDSLTQLFSETSKSNLGSTAVTGGSAVAAAALTSLGLKGIGLTLGGGVLSSAAGVLGGVAAGATGIGAAGLAGGVIGNTSNALIDRYTQGSTSEGFQGNIIERLIFKIDQLIGGQAAQRITAAQKVIVEAAPRDFTISKQPTRGSSH